MRWAVCLTLTLCFISHGLFASLSHPHASQSQPDRIQLTVQQEGFDAALESLNRATGMTLNIRGEKPSMLINVNINNATFEKAVEAFMTAANIRNYALSQDRKNKQATIWILQSVGRESGMLQRKNLIDRKANEAKRPLSESQLAQLSIAYNDEPVELTQDQLDRLEVPEDEGPVPLTQEQLDRLEVYEEEEPVPLSQNQLDRLDTWIEEGGPTPLSEDQLERLMPADDDR